MPPFSGLDFNTISLNASTVFTDPLWRRDSGALQQFAQQFRNPNDILSVLLLLWPDVVRGALAQMSGSRFVPVAFSFGWVSYAISALASVFGDGFFMPNADFNALVISAESGHARPNESWIIGRLLRDHERRAKPFCSKKNSPLWESLRVSVVRVDECLQASHPSWDWVWASGIVVMVVQFAVSGVPLWTASDWSPLFITTIGTVLALLQGSLSQWRNEKWSCAVGRTSTVTITKGNGSRHALVVLGSLKGLDLSLLAMRSASEVPSLTTKVYLVLLAICWLLLLLVVAGLQRGSWYLLTIGTIGMAQNIVAASCSRTPSAFGIHLKHVDTISANKVSKTLVCLEDRYPGAGISLLPIFFPGGFRCPQGEISFWEAAEKQQQRSNSLDTDLHTNQNNPSPMSQCSNALSTVDAARTGQSITVPDPLLIVSSNVGARREQAV